MKCTHIREKLCNCLCFEIDQEMDAILLIIDIVYGVCRIVIKSYLLTLPLFAGVSRVRALSPAWTGSHARETLISRTHLFLPHDLPQHKNKVQ